MRAIRLPNGRLLIPVEADDPDYDFDLMEIGPDDYGLSRWTE